MLETTQPPLLSLFDVSKRYGATVALDKVELIVHRGTIHAVLGENGAGKSTLMKSMVGVVSPDEGSIKVDGAEVAISDPHAAAAMGIVCVFQELSLIPDLSVAENITLTAPPLTRFGTIDRRKSRQIARDLFKLMGVDGIHPDTPCGALPMTKQQLVEIAKALHLKPRLLILDEATSALSADDVERLFDLLHKLRDQGTAILFISHRMHEIDEVADTCSVFRNGSHIETFKVGTRSDDERVQMMIGRPLQQVYPPKCESISHQGTPRLETRGLSWENQLHDISLTVMPGEICGLGGLEGQGQNDFLLSLFGVLKNVRGEILLDGNPFAPAGPRQARDGLALVPESRKTEGLHLEMSVADNLTLASLEELTDGVTLSAHKERGRVVELIREFEIKTETPDVPVGALSGGNQQKVLLAKWIARGPNLLLLNDPTRGVDVGTKQQIYVLLRKLADQGMSIILYSTDYDELIGLCDSVHVFYGGRDVAQLDGDALTEKSLMHAAMGQRQDKTKMELAS